MDPNAIFDRVSATLRNGGVGGDRGADADADAGAVVFGFHGAAPPEEKEGPRDACFRAQPARIVEVMMCLRDAADLRFDFLQNLTAVDWLKRDVIEVVYHLYSYPHRHEACVKVEVPRSAPRVPSVAAVWPTANWLEREQFDLLGVVFEGHPDLRRILMPDDWVGHPMRKDFHEPRSYRGMPTSRPSPMDLLATFDRAHATPPDVSAAREAKTTAIAEPPGTGGEKS